MTDAPASPVRPAVGRLVLERELRAALLILIVCSTAGAAAVGTMADLPAARPSTLADAIVRRFDLTVLWISAFLAGTRIAMNIELDERGGWLDSFIAAGASGRRYVAGVASAAFVGAALTFSAAATSFSLAVMRVHDSRELVLELPRTIGLGIIALAHWCIWFALIGVLLRRALPVVALGTALAAAPTLLMFVQLQQTGFVSDNVLRAMLLLPPMIWGGSAHALLTQLFAMTLMSALALAGAQRTIGRHA